MILESHPRELEHSLRHVSRPKLDRPSDDSRHRSAAAKVFELDFRLGNPACEPFDNVEPDTLGGAVICSGWAVLARAERGRCVHPSLFL